MKSSWTSNKYIRFIFKWVMIAVTCAMILIGAVVAYLFIADMFYKEDDDNLNENGELSMLKKEDTSIEYDVEMGY
ncbi:hypothetical protein [Halobacillus sp. A5]|uniref:hypothetical protein n=1 Tax=Halobacillus sp. A5 TaxID=2880263 RepID=UPI0020A6AA4B|nr:hypothetical protein [Halobacillus sp. A5]MCP3026886.1 hypothetical protein [Halobacillus sp. A5]